jgi:hypothetical protein
MHEMLSRLEPSDFPPIARGRLHRRTGFQLRWRAELVRCNLWQTFSSCATQSSARVGAGLVVSAALHQP